MAKSYTARKRVRKNFGRIPDVAPMPNLIEVQKSSYDYFLQMGRRSGEPRPMSAYRRCSSQSFR